jgi:hypothetical protein
LAAVSRNGRCLYGERVDCCKENGKNDRNKKSPFDKNVHGKILPTRPNNESAVKAVYLLRLCLLQRAEAAFASLFETTILVQMFAIYRLFT